MRKLKINEDEASNMKHWYGWANSEGATDNDDHELAIKIEKYIDSCERKEKKKNARNKRD